MPVNYLFFLLIIAGGLLVAFRFRWERQASEEVKAIPTPVVPASLEAADAAPDSRRPVTALLLGGLALVLMSQSVYAARQPAVPVSLYLLSFLGFAAFLTAGHAIVQQRDDIWRSRPIQTLGHTFRIGPGQLVLLAFAPCFAYLARLAAGDGLQAIQAPVSVVAWLLAVAAVIAGSYRKEGTFGRLSRAELLVSAALFLGAFVLRSVLLEQIPTTLSGDEASAGLSSARFLTGEATNLFGLGWFSFPSLYFAIQSSGIWLLGQTTEGLRISSAVAGALTVVGLYWLGRVLVNRTTGLFAALYLAGFHFHIHFSRIGLQNIWDGLFLVWALAGLWIGWTRGRRAGFILCGLALGLGQYFYVSIRVMPLLLLIWAGLAALVDRDRFMKRLPDLTLTALIALVVILPMALFFVRYPEEFSAPMQRVSVLNGWLESEAQLTGQSPHQIILRQMADTAFGFTHLPLRHWYNPGTPLLLAVPAALFLLGLFWLLYSLNLGFVLILLPMVALVLLGGFSQDAPASQRFVLAAPMAALLVALPVGQVADWLRALWPRERQWITLGALVLMVAITAGDIRYYFGEVYEHYILGGPNTQAATAIAHYLRDQEPPEQTVYFLGWPRMGYFSLSTIPYLAPEMEGHDVLDPLVEPPGWELDGPTLFILLPERIDELQYIQAAFPGGRYREFPAPDRPDGPPLFIAYEVQS